MADIFELFKKISTSNGSNTAPVTWLIAGLGNPGEQYLTTRHNAGFMAIDSIAEFAGVKIDRLKFRALTAEATLFGNRVLLMKPQTMMNLSGLAIGEAAKFYKISPDHVIVLSDDISLEPGRLRARKKGSAGGHNGLKSIIENLSSEEFPRIKLGVGAKPTPDYDLADWVLGNFPKEKLSCFRSTFPAVKDGIEKILAGDFDAAMQICNSFHGGEKA